MRYHLRGRRQCSCFVVLWRLIFRGRVRASQPPSNTPVPLVHPQPLRTILSALPRLHNEVVDEKGLPPTTAKCNVKDFSVACFGWGWIHTLDQSRITGSRFYFNYIYIYASLTLADFNKQLLDHRVKRERDIEMAVLANMYPVKRVEFDKLR